MGERTKQQYEHVHTENPFANRDGYSNSVSHIKAAHQNERPELQPMVKLFSLQVAKRFAWF